MNEQYQMLDRAEYAHSNNAMAQTARNSSSNKTAKINIRNGAATQTSTACCDGVCKVTWKPIRL